MTPAQQLYEAIKAGDTARATELVEAEPELVRGGGAAGIAPLMLAIYTQQPVIAEMLQAHGAPVDVFAAAALGRTEECRKLATADENALHMCSSDGWTPLHLACFFGRKDTAKMLLELGADASARSANGMHNIPLHSAAAGRHEEICAMLLRAGCDVNATQQGSYTALHSAAANGDLGIVRLLLAHEAKHGVKSETGETPLDLARKRGNTDVANLLERTAR